MDKEGSDAAALGATTSGQVMVYAVGGKLLFGGGITDGRGHEGDNAGSEAVLALLREEKPSGIQVRRLTDVRWGFATSIRNGGEAIVSPSLDLTPEIRKLIDERAVELRRSYEQALWKRTDRLFAGLLALQWIAGVAMALWLSPLAWEGMESHIHPHVWGAVILGGLITIFPIMLALLRPGQMMTRLVISAAQMMHSALLIHLSGGRIETHFHVFGSLAFLSFYRDWRVLVPATAVIALDHAMRGIFWPESVFGVLSASPWRWMEHAGWVIFEDIFLVWACVRGAGTGDAGDAAGGAGDGQPTGRGRGGAADGAAGVGEPGTGGYGAAGGDGGDRHRDPAQRGQRAQQRQRVDDGGDAQTTGSRRYRAW